MTSTTSRSEGGIRPCRRQELPEVLSLWQDSRGSPGKTDDQLSLKQLLDHDEESLLVAVRDSRIVGTVIATWDGWRGNLYRLTVHPEWQRRGIAAQLIKKDEDGQPRATRRRRLRSGRS